MFRNPFNPNNTATPDSFDQMDTIDMTGISEVNNPFTSANPDVTDTSNVDYAGDHFVEPHSVSSYDRQDGTHVEGYWRDGDGNTDIDATTENGGGYIQTNPDGILENNFSFWG
ncbi:hypothetical protein ACS52_14325 [Bacillus cereus]|nr:hypothetical protein ACS52_14325 [Bacillus cereus]HDR7251523.1 hypothetical protein [Bacillus pacificus]